jgi:hypothetical protein
MTSSLQLVYQDACTGLWAEWDYTLCPCRNGWFLSDVDTWHKCQFHFDSTLGLHPEDDHAIASEEDFKQYRVRQLRKTYVMYAECAKLTVKEMTRRVMQICNKTDSPERMIEVARDICDSELDIFWSKDQFV